MTINNTIVKKLPHLLKYMGSKREIIDFIEESVDELNANSLWFCDLFAGSSIVAGSLKERFNVHANDIQSYSEVFSKTYFSDFSKIDFSILDDIENEARKYAAEFKEKHPEFVFQYSKSMSLEDFIKIEKSQQKLINVDFGFGFHLFTQFYSGTYWSYEQCIWIDSLRAVAERYKNQHSNQDIFNAIMSSLMFAMSYTSQSTGHYAQYRDARSESSMFDILSYRERELWPYFERKFLELLTIEGDGLYKSKVTTLDYLDCLRIIEPNTIVYADPPYQSVHYSRFYHVLETLVRYDNPKVEYKGRYREDRHQSPFCKKTTVKKAFENLFEGVRLKNSHLILSYCDTGMISLEEINSIAQKVFSNNYTSWVKEKKHTHSKMGRSDVRSQEVIEYTILFKRR
jgi:adenine-specific DNA-methyltransferase